MDGLISDKTIYVVATPIGNLGDVSLRAKSVLAGVDLILAEDTRETRKLLSHLEIKPKNLISYNDHTDAKKRQEIVSKIQQEELSVALVSDAGTPCVSDPGYKFIRDARSEGVTIVPVPGASALMSLVSASGLPSDTVVFVGFLPHKEGAVRKQIESWERFRPTSLVFFDSMKRLARDLEILKSVIGHCEVAIGRELTKRHEEIFVDSIDRVMEWLSNEATLKGEVSVQVYIGSSDPAVERDHLWHKIEEDAKSRFMSGEKLKDILKDWRDQGISRSELYDRLLKIKDQVRSSDT